jgi:virulence-associated protein VagC
MTTAKVCRSGDCHGVRLPQQIRLHGGELGAFRRGGEIILRDQKGPMLRAFQSLASLRNDLTIADPPERPATKAQRDETGETEEGLT